MLLECSSSNGIQCVVCSSTIPHKPRGCLDKKTSFSRRICTPKQHALNEAIQQSTCKYSTGSLARLVFPPFGHPELEVQRKQESVAVGIRIIADPNPPARSRSLVSSPHTGPEKESAETYSASDSLRSQHG
jgi:hypothetical protein